jgi:hypothetical protein
LWDLAGWYQRRDMKHKANPYMVAWQKAYYDPTRPDVSKPWSSTNKWRALPTTVGLVLTVVICALEWGHGTHVRDMPQFSSSTSIWIDTALIAVLVVYRLVKDALSSYGPTPRLWAPTTPGMPAIVKELQVAQDHLKVQSQSLGLWIDEDSRPGTPHAAPATADTGE